MATLYGEHPAAVELAFAEHRSEALCAPDPLQAIQQAHWQIHRAHCDYQDAAEERGQLAVDVGEITRSFVDELVARGWWCSDGRPSLPGGVRPPLPRASAARAGESPASGPGLGARQAGPALAFGRRRSCSSQPPSRARRDFSDANPIARHELSTDECNRSGIHRGTRLSPKAGRRADVQDADDAYARLVEHTPATLAAGASRAKPSVGDSGRAPD